MADRKTIPLYQQRAPSGAVREQFAGVRATRTGDAPAVWRVEAATIPGVAPRPGDRMRGTDGAWWEVTAVGPLTGGAYPCQCDPLPES